MDASATPPSSPDSIPASPIALMPLGDATAAACVDDACELPVPPPTD